MNKMNSVFGTSLLNPKPMNGDIQKGNISASGIASKKRGLPTTASLQTPDLRTSTIEQKVNSTAAAPIFCKPFLRQYEKHYGEGDLLFVKREGATNHQRNLHLVANLAVFNYLLRTETMGGLDDSKIRKYSDLEIVMRDWNWFGIMLNDMDTGSRFQRLLNVTVRGRCRLPNYFSTDGGKKFGENSVKKGEVVYIGFKKQRHEEATLVRCPDGSYEMVQATDEDNLPAENELDNNVNRPYYQAYPVLENDMGDYELLIPIGVVSQVPYKNVSIDRRLAARLVTSQNKLLDMMEVFIRV